MLTHTQTRRGAGDHRIGIDVGGTFTDFSVMRLADGAIFNHKEPSTPADPSLAVQRGIAAVLRNHALAPSDIGLVVHGTTIGLNAILQNKGARLSLVVSSGNRDILEIGRGRMARPYAMFGDKERPLVPRSGVFECSARGGADGVIVSFPTAGELDALANSLLAVGSEAVAIALLNAYACPQMESDIRHELEIRLPGLPITTSTDVWPEMREYERCLVAALNASIHPLMTRYFEQLRSRLADLRIDCNIFITASNGGTLSLATAEQRPIDTVLSGPASGVVAASDLAREHGLARVVTVDIGGTSSDMAVCTPSRPEVTTQSWLGELPLITPTVNVTAIGAGGGSLIRVDEQGLLKVGPESAGADPGPVCYGRGGDTPTVTDCYLAMGFLRPDGFAGGRMQLDATAAMRALDPIGAALGLGAADRAARAAAAALSVATANMATEMLKDLARRGVDPGEVSLLPFGGAGPTHAAMLAEEVRIQRIVVPPAPGLFCAFGALAADARRDFIRSIKRVLTESSVGLATEYARRLRTQAANWLEEEGPLITTRSFLISLDMRYVGQAHEINVEVPEGAEFTTANIAARFHAAHRTLHGFADVEGSIELQSVRVQAIGSLDRARPAQWRRATDPVPTSRRPVWYADDWVDFKVVQRESLGPGDVLRGPTLVEQADTTVVVPHAWTAKVVSDGTLMMEKQR